MSIRLHLRHQFHDAIDLMKTSKHALPILGLCFIIVSNALTWYLTNYNKTLKLKREALGNLDFSAVVCASSLAYLRQGKVEDAIVRLENYIDICLLTSHSNMPPSGWRGHMNSLHYVARYRLAHGEKYRPEPGTPDYMRNELLKNVFKSNIK